MLTLIYITLIISSSTLMFLKKPSVKRRFIPYFWLLNELEWAPAGSLPVFRGLPGTAMYIKAPRPSQRMLHIPAGLKELLLLPSVKICVVKITFSVAGLFNRLTLAVVCPVSVMV